MKGPPFWFRARRYGWGWGLPLRWQGWLVLALYAILFLLGSLIASPGDRPVAFFIYVNIISLGLIAVCWLKGEPTRWRWGE